MGDRSPLVVLLLLALIAIQIASLVIKVGSDDKLREEVVALDRNVVTLLAEQRRQANATQSALEALAARLDQGVAVAPGSPAASTEAPGASSDPSTDAATPGSERGDPTPKVQFANLEYRDPDAVDGGRIVQAVSTFTGNLNDMVNNDSACSQIWSVCHDAVAERNYDRITEWEPKLAESWEVSEDGLTYTIHLRRGVLWHPVTDPLTGDRIEATELTADDFRFYFEVVRNPTVLAGFLRGYWMKCKEVKVIDRYTFQVIWGEPYSEAEKWALGMRPMPRHYYMHDREKLPPWPEDFTTAPEEVQKAYREFALFFNESKRNFAMTAVGPYRFAEWNEGEKRIVLKRWEQYYGPKPHLKTRVLRVQKNPEVMLLEFEKGQYDYVGVDHSKWKERTQGPDYVEVTGNPKTATEDSIAWDIKKKNGELNEMGYKFEKYMSDGFSWRYIGWNMKRPLFQDPAVRVALAHLVNRQRIIQDLYYGLATEISGPFVPRSAYYDHDIKPWPFDLEEATRRLEAAGWTDSDGDGILDKDLDGDGTREPFAFTLEIPNNRPIFQEMAQILKNDFGKAGIDMGIRTSDWTVFIQTVTDERNFDACILGWVGGLEGDPYQVWHSDSVAGGGSNFVGWINEESDKLIETGRVTMAMEERAKIYQRFHRILHEQQPYAFLVAPASLFAIDRRYRNVRIYKAGGPDWWVPVAEQKPVP